MPLEGVYQDPVTGTGTLVPLQCDSTGRLIVVGAGGGGGGGTSDTTEATQQLVKVAVQSIDSKTAALQSGAAPVTAVPRQCLGRQTLALSAGTVTTLTVPGGAVAAAIQADGGTIRVTLDGATAPTATVGTRIDDGVIYYVETALANVKLLAPVACSAQVVYFDRA